MTPGPRARLDHVLVRRGLVPTREQAQAAIAAGRVLVGGAVAERASRLVAPDEPLEMVGPSPQYVGRGGEKLEAALSRFAVTVAGRVALDAGASTGGFTDCLLQHGAAAVAAVDVGHGQLHPRVRGDGRVLVLERTNLRDLTVVDLSAAADRAGMALRVPVDLVTADLSFISLTAVVPVLAGCLVEPGGDVVLLVKPQFEVGRADASRGKGVVRDPALWRQALDRVASSLAATTAAIMGAMPSPVTGAAGNTEFFLHGRAHAGAAPPARVVELLDAAVVAAGVQKAPADRDRR